ncbi:VOC family protein [Halovivax gelatinilyticus]|uniref:VOC family protein n=1 Tax=Halovivax gelatinilyticus TaxID=2961597 RepID=UPI0020CA605D|nr:VOC family protein [Halovivax gelatinilyticus]
MVSIGNVTFACDDPDGLASFWASALGYEREEWPDELREAWEASGGDPNAAAAIVDPTGDGPRLYFQKKAKSPTESIPIHLDLDADDREETVERLVDLGASEVETKTREIGPVSETWTVMRDPEGNGFCVQAPPEP